MKKASLLLTALFLCFYSVTGCSNSPVPTEKATSNSSNVVSSAAAKCISMTFAKLPSPPKCKKTSDAETIHKVTDYIDNYEKAPIESQKTGGWQMLITLTFADGQMKQYSVTGDTLQINTDSYKVSSQFKDNLEALYNQLNIPEEKYPS